MKGGNRFMSLYKQLNNYSGQIDSRKIRPYFIDEARLSKEEQDEFYLISKVLSVYEVFYKNGTKVRYKFWAGNNDLDSEFINKSEQYKLKKLLEKDIPLSIKARIEGILCYLDFGFMVDIVEKIVTDYLKLFNIAVKKSDWYLARVFSIVAINISRKTGKNTTLFLNTVRRIKAIVMSVNFNDNSVHFVLALIKKLATIDMISEMECKDILEQALTICNKTIFNEVLFIVRTLKMDVRDYVKRAVNLLVETADKKDNDAQAVSLLSDAIVMSRENGLDDKELKKRLNARGKSLEENMKTIQMEVPVEVDEGYFEEKLKGKSLKEALCMMMKLIDVPSKLDYEEPVTSEIVSFCNIDDNGLIVDKSSADEQSKYLKFSSYFTVVSAHIIMFLDVLNKIYDYDEASFRFLFEDNAFIEDERINIFTCAYNLAFRQRYYEAVHLLALQSEYVFRRLAGFLVLMLLYFITTEQTSISNYLLC